MSLFCTFSFMRISDPVLVFLISSFQCMHGSKCKIGSYCTVGRRLQEVNILGGLILPVWGTIEKALAKQVRQIHKRIRVVRLVTTNDSPQRIVGLLIPNSAVESVLTGLQWVQDIDGWHGKASILFFSPTLIADYFSPFWCQMQQPLVPLNIYFCF